MASGPPERPNNRTSSGWPCEGGPESAKQTPPRVVHPSTLVWSQAAPAIEYARPLRQGPTRRQRNAVSIAIADFGTPSARRNGHAVAEVALSIDGQSLRVPAGTSIMRAARAAGLDIPKLCATDALNAFGSCRVCLVEVAGRRGLVASCTEPVADGMVVRTQTDDVARVRRGVLELYISDHPLDCLTCAANGDCELQDVAGAVGLRDVRFEPGANHLEAVADTSNPYFQFDPAKCIVCSRCVRACDEVQGTFALAIDGRGFASKVATGADAFFDSECVSCGACVQACPTATLIEKSVVEHGVPDRSVDTTCAYCGVGCSFRAEVKGDQVVRMVPHKDGKANHGHSCVKGRFAWGYANHRDRVTAPMIRESTAEPWRETSWEEAVAYAAQRLKAVQAKHGRKSIGGITSSRCTNEGSVGGAEDGAHRLRQQQRGHLRPGVPLAHRLRLEARLRHLGRHPGLRLGARCGCDGGDRRQSHPGASGVRLADEAALARRRETGGVRPAAASKWCARRISKRATTWRCGRAPTCR